MANLNDHMGRPIVAVTGIGVVTSLGVGKADNWAALTSGKSGILLVGIVERETVGPVELDGR
ncbi:MAG: hypothetical protein E5V30_32505, partial [Mesorhizobium sp.]